MKKLLVIVTALLAVLLVANVVALLLLPARTETGPVGPKPVTLTFVEEPSCVECFDARLYQPELERLGVVFSDVKTVTRSSKEGERFIKKYGLTQLPALIFSEELGDYPTIADAWALIGTRGPDGSYLLQGTNPPYYDVTTGSVRGLVTVTLLDDADCAACYDPVLHLEILEQYGVFIAEKRVLDLSSAEGAALAARYDIAAVPTIILEGEIGLYPSIASVWPSVGRIQDGAYIFTALEGMGAYKELATGDVIVPDLV